MGVKVIHALEILPGRDYDRRRGFSRWLYIRFPVCSPWQMTASKSQQMTEVARAAFVERYDYEPLLIQNVECSAWWRAGPVEGDTMIQIFCAFCGEWFQVKLEALIPKEPVIFICPHCKTEWMVKVKFSKEATP